MDPVRLLKALVEPLRVGDELAPGLRLESVSAELGLRLTFARGRSTVQVEVEPLEDGRPYAARSERFQCSYRTGDKRWPLDARVGREVCARVAARLREREDAVLSAFRDEALRAGAEAFETARVREVRVERLLEPAGDERGRFYTVSPYVGCLIGCRFCYAQSRLQALRGLLGLPELPWGSWVDARANAADLLARELETAQPWPVKFCPVVSDPYHAIERRYRLTRRCLEVLRDEGRGREVFVLTRGSLVREDAALLAAIPGAHVGVSLPTADDEVRAHFEPRGASVRERLETLAVLRAAGVRTFAMVQPVLPGSLEALSDALAAVADSVQLDVLRGVEGAAAEFSDPRFAFCARESWQRESVEALRGLLAARGVRLWAGELPDERS